MSQIPTSLMSGQAGAAKAFLLRMFTHHPVAKLMSLGMAILLVFLIDRELQESIYERTVEVVTMAAVGELDRLEVRADGYLVLLPDQRPRVAVEIWGHKKERQNIVHPFEAVIPKGRVEAALGSAEEGKVTVERGDVRSGGLDLRFNDLELSIARRRDKEVSIQVRGDRTGRMTPDVARVFGPQSRLRNLKAIWIDVDGPLAPDELKAAISQSLADATDHCELAPEQEWSLALGEIVEKRGTISFGGVQIFLETVPGPDYPEPRFEYDQPPGARDWRISVVFEAPESVIKRLTENVDEKGKVEQALRAIVDADRLVAGHLDELEKLAGEHPDDRDRWWFSVIVGVRYPPDVLAAHQLSPELTSFTLRARLTKKAPQ